jgi:hypothetical protein
MLKTFLGKRKAIITVGALLALTATATAANVSGSTGPGPRLIQPSISHGLKPAISPQGYDCTTGTSAPFYCVGAENDSSLNGFAYGVYGLEGYAPNATGGVGVLGYSGNSTVNSAYGVYGVTFATNGIGVYGAGDGPAPAAGATPSSTQQSTGVVGNSASGDGVYGSTEFPNGSTTGQVAGIVGVDSTTTGYLNDGVVGVTTNGGYGVVGLSSNAPNPAGTPIAALGGVYGSATGGYGVVGSSSSSYGVLGESATSDGVHGITSSSGDSGVAGIASGTSNGVYGSSTGGWGGNFFSTSEYGLVGQTNSSASYAGTYGGGNSADSYGVWGSNHGSGIGVYALSATGDAIYARTSGGVGADIANSNGNGVVAQGSYIGLLGRAPAGASTYPLVLTDSNSNDLFYVNGDGDVFYHGSLNTFARTRSGLTASSFTPRVSSPTVEDVGSGQLVNGSAIVRIDPAVAAQMDQSTVYHVFLTPDGDTRGLFVAQKTPQGFVVRETQGGHGSLAFDYRVVATVDGQAGRRSTLSVASSNGPSVQIVAPKVNPQAFGPAPSRPKPAVRTKASSASALRQLFIPRANLALEGRTR